MLVTDDSNKTILLTVVIVSGVLLTLLSGAFVCRSRCAIKYRHTIDPQLNAPPLVPVETHICLD